MDMSVSLGATGDIEINIRIQVTADHLWLGGRNDAMRDVAVASAVGGVFAAAAGRSDPVVAVAIAGRELTAARRV